MVARSGRLSKRRGQALAEMALMVPFLIIGMMGFLDLGRAFYYQISLTNAVREAARFGALPQYLGLAPACNSTPIPNGGSTGSNCPVPSDQQICDRMHQELQNTGFDATWMSDCTNPSFKVNPDMNQRVSDCGTSGTCQYQIQVSAQYQFHFITPIIGSLIGDPLHLNTSATFRTEY
jgi:hypothetical protein